MMKVMQHHDPKLWFTPTASNQAQPLRIKLTQWLTEIKAELWQSTAYSFDRQQIKINDFAISKHNVDWRKSNDVPKCVSELSLINKAMKIFLVISSRSTRLSNHQAVKSFSPNFPLVMVPQKREEKIRKLLANH